MTMRDLLIGGVSFTTLFTAGAAIAQVTQTHADQPNTAAPQEPTALAEIVVTAQKRAERLQDTPVAVAALTAETLTQTSVDSTRALTSLVPGLNISDSSFGFRPFLRGVGTNTSAAGNENSVSTYLDNVYLTSMNAGLLSLSSIQSIEVLKGPQGTLFGRNASGGVIHIKTKDPSHTFAADASVSYDNYQTAVTTAYITGGLTDTMAADLAVYYRHQGEGYGINLATGHEADWDNDFTIRSKVLFTPSDVDTFTLAFDYSQIHASGQPYVPFPGSSVQWGPPDATHPLPFGAPYQFRGGTWDLDMANDPFYKSNGGGASATYTHDFSWASLSSFTAYRKDKLETAWNATPIPTNAQYAGYEQPEQQFSQELQLSPATGSYVKWITGLYYLHASVRYDPFFISGLAIAPIEQQFRMKQTIDSPAAYGQFTVPVGDDTNFTGGLRYTIDKRAINGEIDVVRQSDPATILRVVNPTDASKTFRTFTWRLSADHHFTSDIMSYISYNRGFKAGSYNTIPPAGPTAKPTNPEYLDAYEIGLKNTLFGGRATLDLAAFLYDYKDLQVTIFNQTAATTLNAARARIDGLDLDFNFQATDNLRLSLGAELLDAKFTDYPNGPILTELSLAQGGGATTRYGDLTGKRLPYSSRAVANAGIFYQVPTPVGTVDPNVNLTWNDGYTFEPSAVIRQAPFVDLNATLGWTLKNGTTRISAFGKNLTNAKVARTGATGSNPGGYLEVQYRPPLTYGLMISQKF